MIDACVAAGNLDPLPRQFTEAEIRTTIEQVEKLGYMEKIPEKLVQVCLKEKSLDPLLIYTAPLKGRRDLASGFTPTPAIALLLEKGASCYRTDNDGMTPLMHVTKNGNIHALLILLPKSDINSTDNNGATALMHAAAAGDLTAVQCLLRHKADADIKDGNNWTAFTHAICNGHRSAVKALLKAKVVKADELENALTRVIERFKYATDQTPQAMNQPMSDVDGSCSYHEMVNLLLKKGATYREELLENRNKTPECFRVLLEGHQPVLEEKNDSGSELEDEADDSDNEYPPIDDDPWSDLNKQDEDDLTPLMQKARYGYNPEIRDLLRRGADPNAQSKGRWTATALIRTARNNRGDVKTLQVLWEGGAKLDIQDEEGKTALMYAIIHGNIAAVEFLLNQGAEDNGSKSILQVVADKPSWRNRDTEEALNQELASSSVTCGEMFRYLLQRGVNPAAVKANPKTPAAFKRLIEEYERGLQVEGGANPLDRMQEILTELNEQERSDALDQWLAEEGHTIDTATPRGITLLILATQENYEDAVRILLERYKANPDARTASGETALQVAISQGNFKIAELLLQQGAQAESPDNPKESAFREIVRDFEDGGVRTMERQMKGGEGGASYWQWLQLLLDHGADPERLEASTFKTIAQAYQRGFEDGRAARPAVVAAPVPANEDGGAQDARSAAAFAALAGTPRLSAVAASSQSRAAPTVHAVSSASSAAYVS